MNPWLTPYYWFKSPLSGDVTQDISPNWFSPTVEVNYAGDKNIEAKVISEVASYGKQLGILSEAVLALAGDNMAPEIERLREVNDQVNKIKEENSLDLGQTARESLERLWESDPDAFADLIRHFSAEISLDKEIP